MASPHQSNRLPSSLERDYKLPPSFVAKGGEEEALALRAAAHRAEISQHPRFQEIILEQPDWVQTIFEIPDGWFIRTKRREELERAIALIEECLGC